MKNIIGIVLSYVFIAIIIVAAKFFEKAGKEASRKFIHIMLSNWWFLAMYFFDNVIWASIVPLSFVIILQKRFNKSNGTRCKRERWIRNSILCTFIIFNINIYFWNYKKTRNRTMLYFNNGVWRWISSNYRKKHKKYALQNRKNKENNCRFSYNAIYIILYSSNFLM